MFGQYTYLFYTLIFTLPFIFFLWIYYYQILRGNIRTILIVTFILTLYGFFLWPTGLIWGTWAYNSKKLLGITVFGTVLEDIIWWVVIALLLTSFTIVVAKKEEKRESLLKRT